MCGAEVAAERKSVLGRQPERLERDRGLDHVSLALRIHLRDHLGVGQNGDTVHCVFLHDAGAKDLRLLLVGHLAVDHGRGLALEVADRQPQVALHRLSAFGIRRGGGAKLQINRVAAGIEKLWAVRAVDPRRFVLHLPADVKIGVVAGHGDPHPRARLLLESRLLRRLEALEVGVEVAGERDRGLLDRILLVAFRGLHLLLAECAGRLHVVGGDHHLAAGEPLDRVQTRDLDVPKRGLAGLDVDLAVLSLSHGSAEVFATEAWRRIVEDGAGHGLVRPLGLEAVALEQPREVEAVFGEQVPLADVAVDGPDAADRRGQKRVADEPKGPADEPDFRRRRVVRAVHAGEGVGIFPEGLAAGHVESREEGVVHRDQPAVVRCGHRAACKAGHLAGASDVIPGCSTFREVRDLKLQVVGIEGQVAVHVERPAVVAGQHERRRMRRQFVGLLLFVAVGVSPEDRFLLRVLDLDGPAQGEPRVPEPFADFQAGRLARKHTVDRHQVELAVAAFRVKGSTRFVRVERAQAHVAAGLRVDPPLAALAGHDVRIAGVDRAATGAVMRGAEEILDEAPLLLVGHRPGLPHAQPLRRLVRLRHPELALLVHHEAGWIEHAVLHEWADRRASALAADCACGLAVGREHLHLLDLALHAHVEPALLVGGHAAHAVEAREDGLDCARLWVDRHDVALVLHHVDEVVADGADEARLLQIDDLHDGAGVAGEHRHKADPHRQEIFWQRFFDVPAVRQGEISGGELPAVGHEALVSEHPVQDVDHVVADVRYQVMRRCTEFVQVELWIVLELLDLGLGIGIQLGEERP